MGDELKLNIKLTDVEKPNDLLGYLCNQGQVYHFVELILCVNEIFNKKLKKFYEAEKIPFSVEETKESSSFVVFNRAWSYISKVNLNNSEDLEAIMDYKKTTLISTLNQGIQYFESTEQYERCAKLLKIKNFKKT